MSEIRNPNLFQSDRYKPYSVVRPRKDRGSRPNRNSRFVPDFLEPRLTLSGVAPLPVQAQVAPDDLPPTPNPLPVPKLPFDPPVPRPPSGPAIPF